MYNGKKLFKSAVNDTVKSVVIPFHVFGAVPKLISNLSVVATDVSKEELDRRLKKMSDAFIAARETYAVPRKPCVYAEARDYEESHKKNGIFGVDDTGELCFSIATICNDDKCEQWLIKTVQRDICGSKLVSKSRLDFNEYFKKFYAEMIEVIKEESPLFVKVR